MVLKIKVTRNAHKLSNKESGSVFGSSNNTTTTTSVFGSSINNNGSIFGKKTTINSNNSVFGDNATFQPFQPKIRQSSDPSFSPMSTTPAKGKSC